MASIFRRIFNRFRNPFRMEIKNFLLWKDALPDALIVVDEVGKIVEVNVQAERMFGYTREEMLGQSIEMLIPERYRDLHVEERLHYALSPKMRPMGSGLDLRALRKDGTEFPVDICLSPIETKEGLYVIAVIRDMSKREETMKKAFGEIEELFRVLTEASLVGVYFIQDWRFIYVNQAAASMFGYTVDEIIGKLGPLDLTHPDDHPKVIQNIRRRVIGEVESVRYEFKGVKKDGTIIYAEVYGKRVEYKGRIGILGTVIDITERKQMEEAIKRESALNKYLVEVAKAINQTLDLDSLLELIMNKVLELTNSKHGGLFILDETNGVLRLRASRGIAPDIARSLTFKIGEGIVGWVAETGKGVLLHDGEKHPRFKKFSQFERFSSMIVVPLIVKGKVFGTLGVDRLEGEEPFTEMEFRIAQSFAEQAALAIQNSQLFEEIKTRKEYLETILESSHDLIFTVKKDGTFGYANKRLKEIFGYNFEDIKGRHFLEFIPQHLHDFMLKKWQEIQQGIGGVYETQVIKADGSIADCRVSHSKLEGRDEYVVALRDITEIKKAEEERRKLQEQLFQSQKMESIGTLASGIAHDFNNILGIIAGQAFLLERFIDNPARVKTSLEAINKAVQRGSALVRQILTFARKTEFTFRGVQVNDVILEVVKLMKETFPKTIEVITDLQDDLPFIWADLTQLYQVLLNLCVNARDAMPFGGKIKITSRLVSGKFLKERYPKAKARDYVEIQVQDTGIGMDNETLKRIFEPFFTTKGPGRGTGLGLSVVLGIVEGHDGIIDVESEPGKGTTFFIYLPVKEADIFEISEQEKVEEEIRGGTETILIVEDEEMLREFLKEALISNGYKVFMAQDGEEAIEIYSKHRDEIDVVLTDLGLPKMMGSELLERLKQLNPEVKVIIASGFINPEVKEEISKAGAKYFIQKPYSINELLKRIRDVIEDKD